MIALQALIIFVIASSLLGIIFLPRIARKSLTLVSPYGKVNPNKRVLAGIIDCSIMMLIFISLVYINLIFAATFSLLYVLIRDTILPGQSIGKYILGLTVMHLKEGKPCRMIHSIKRNFLFVVPGLNVVALFFEIKLLFIDAQGLRIGDRFALTHVVDGAGAKDLLKQLQDEFQKEISTLSKTKSPVKSHPDDKAA